MEIKHSEILTAEHLQLLLEADPAQESVEAYVQRGWMLEAQMPTGIVGVLVAIPTRPETLEIVNVAVALQQRGKGIAQKLITTAIASARKQGIKTVEVGTGSTGIEQLYLYQKCGFRMTHIDRDYFVRHYSEPIRENGLLLLDMVRFSQDI